MENIDNFFNNKNTKKNVVFICIIISLVVVGIISINYFTNPVRKFKSSLENMNIETANEIYSTTSQYTYKKNMENILNEKLEKMLDDFISEKVDYEQVKQNFELFKDISNFSGKIDKAITNLEEIKQSKDYFEKAKAVEKNDLVEAYKNYFKVIEKDSDNYKIAQKFIKSNKSNVKDIVLNDVEELIKNNDYIGAKEKLNGLNDLIENDNTIAEKFNEIEEKATKQEIEKYKSTQEVTVESAVPCTQWYSSDISGIQVIIKNNTDKVVKNFDVGVLAYDENDYPLNIEYNDFLLLGQGRAVNVQPGQTYGDDEYFNIFYNEEKIRKAIACVKKVEYYDGSKWENPYYQYWLEEYKGKPLK